MGADPWYPSSPDGGPEDDDGAATTALASGVLDES